LKTLDSLGDEMQRTHAAPTARLGPPLLAMALTVVALLAMP